MKHKHKQYFLLILLAASIFSLQPVNASLTPIIEKLDLAVDGSITPQWINQTPDTFSFIYRIIFGIHWRNNAIDMDDFGNLNSGLTNGTLLLFAQQQLNDPIKNNHAFAHLAFDFDIQTDDKNPKDNHLLSRLSFFKFVPGGLDVRNNQNLTFGILDNISSAVVDEFEVTIEGYFASDPTGNIPIVPIWSPASIWNAWAPSILPIAISGALLFAAGFSVYIIVRRVFGN